MSAKTVGRASLFMGLMLFLSRVLGLVRDSVMAAQFGRGDITDAYILAFQIPDLLFFLIAGGALSSSFIPVFADYWHNDKPADAWKVFSGVTNTMAAALLVVISVAWWQTDWIVSRMNDANRSEIFPLIAQMSRILLPAQFAFFIGGLMFGTLYARKHYTVPGISPNIYNLGIIAGAFCGGFFFNPGIIGMAWGAVLGAVIGSLIIPMIVLKRLGGVDYSFGFHLSHPGVKKVFILMLPVVLGLSLPGVYAMIMRYFGTLYSQGVVTSLDLSNKLMQAPLGIVGQALAIGVFPFLTQLFAEKKMEEFRETLVKSCRQAIYLAVPVSVVLAMFASDVVAVLYQRGKFTAADGASVAACLTLFCIGIPAWCLHPILMRAYYSMQNTWKPILIGTGATVIFVALCFGLQRTALSYYSLPLASSIVAILLAGALLGYLQKDTDGLDIGLILKCVGQCLIGGLGVAAVCGIALLLPIHGASGEGRNLLGLLRLGLIGLSAVWVYYFITRWLEMPETNTLARALARLDRKKGRTDDGAPPSHPSAGT